MQDQRKVSRISFLSELAYMYYIENLSQNEIAERMFISRSRVSRLLEQAREEGLVEINIKFISDRNYQLESFLMNTMGLKDARVYNDAGRTNSEIFNGVCNFATEYFTQCLRPHMRIGMTHGDLFANITERIEKNMPKADMDLDMIQLIGHHSSPQAGTTAPDNMSRIIRHFGGRMHCLNVPIYIENDTIKNGLLKEPMVSETLEIAHTIDMALIGIKAINSSEQMKKQVIWAGYISDEILDELIAMGTCGHLLGRAIDIEGNLIDHYINKRIIGLEMSHLRKVETAICVATGPERGPVLHGAILGKYINVLITDRSCAQRIMEIYFNRQKRFCNIES